MCLVSEEFTKSFKELKDNFDFDLLFITNNFQDIKKNSYSSMIIDEEILKDKKILSFLKSQNEINKLIITNTKGNFKLNFEEQIEKPLSFFELNKKIVRLVTGQKFNRNSSIKIADYILDKNEKKFKKDNLFIVVTEKETQLLEILFNESKPLSKKDILEKIWHYSSEADTHTVETHIYRLRKKILNKFSDDNLIRNERDGYTI